MKYVHIRCHPRCNSSIRLLLVLILFVKQEADLAITVRKFVYQKDMSEYCRRRVMPSVFLGRQVIDAYSQILHFSRLELPYSCFVSIRTESGSNIILVIQLMSDKSLIESCRDSKNQLLVYEIGETFGGYWGALPDNVMKPEPLLYAKEYTLKTTQPTTTTTTTKSRTTRTRTTASTTENLEDVLKTSTNYDIVVELPLVNVSAIVVPGDLPKLSDTDLMDPEESFDTMIDVKPKPGVSYKTKVLPLAQFAISDEVSGRRTSDDDEAGAPRYEVDLNADLFTPDARLSYPLLRLSARTKQRGKFKYSVNSRLDFKKNKKLLAEKEALLFKSSQASQEQPSVDFQPSDFIQVPSHIETDRASNPFEIVDAILKNLSKTKDQAPKKNPKIDKDVANLLQGLAKIGHNESAYLVPNLSWYTRRTASTTRFISTKYRTDSITWRQPSASYKTNYLEEEEDTSNVEVLPQAANISPITMEAVNNNESILIDVGSSGPLLPLIIDVDRVILNATQQNNLKESGIINPDMLSSEISGTTTSATTPEILKPMILVDHESWENMVQAAPLMAVVLNQSITSSVNEEKHGLNVTLLPPSNVVRRKKRYMHAIPIEHAKPHHLPVNIEIPLSTVHTDKISDAQEFQRLIELQDDEVHDRVALRYLRQYVGPALFNICDFDEAAARHVYLFNSSRLVLAITNFTLERMTVVMTPARTLLSSDARCETAHLECQVSGARVCIDSLSACDGVPNCGSYDIYDEDRLTCGGSEGLQHNVCLAAITFLAVLLTILYTVHYWLKRCVPKVSDAFFIYTDAAENVLYLDPIMRSPHDTEDPNILRGTAMHDYMECTDMGIQKKTVGSFIGRLWRILRCKRKKKLARILGDPIIDEVYEEMGPINRRLFSFAEVELGKMGTPFAADAAVQTGSSLEIQTLEKTLTPERTTDIHSDSDDIVAFYEGKRNRRSKDKRSILDFETSSKEPSDELSILNFFRRARSVSMQMSPPHAANNDEIQTKYPSNTEEKEIQCLEYDQSLISPMTESATATIGDTSDKKAGGSLVRKKLRFEEEMKTIKVSDEDELEEEVVPDQRIRRSVVYGGGKNVHLEDTDSNCNVEEPSTSTNREFKSYFWGSGKNKSKKPTKKKTQQLSLR